MSVELEKMQAEQQRDERRNRNIALTISLSISVILFGLTMFWVAFAGTVPPMEEPEWRTIGTFAADFGTDALGKKDINNFRKPSPTPADRPKTPPKKTPTETPRPAKVSPPTSPAMESNTETEVTTEAPQPTKTETPAPETPATQPDATPVKETSQESPRNPSNTASNSESGGSDDGDTDKTGNHGNPKAQVLGEGMFEFGNGIGGNGGRMPLAIKMPEYNVQNEARIKFRFVISPSGEVILVKPEMTTHTDLARIGAAAIKKWRFSQVEPSRGNLKTSVTITFRLK
ncbi:MAG: hypothetical protein AAGN35_03900 [Bacteroidota bacterium]